MRKGQELLNKIENLLIEIQQPPSQKFFKKNPVKTPSTTRRETALLQAHQKSIEAEKNKLMARLKVAQQKENPEQTFKVRNRTSLYLLAQKPMKPIHQRVEEIQRKKSLDIERIREQNPDPQIIQQEQQEAMGLAMEQRRRNQKKYSLAEVQQKMKELQNREKLRRQKQDLHRAEHIRKEAKKITTKPYVRERSQEIWCQYKEKQELSSSVFARFEQYELRRKEKFDKRMRELKQQITPFAPKISANSKLLASHLTSRRDLSQELNRSLSCRCFQRSQRSLSKSNLRHNRSTALQTSRHL